MGGVRSKTPRSIIKSHDFTLDEIAQKENEPSRSISVNCPSNDTSALTHVSWPEIPSKNSNEEESKEPSKEHFYVRAFRKRYQQEIFRMTTPHFKCLSKEETSFYDLILLPDYVNKNIKFTRYVWEIKGSSEVKGYLSLFIAHNIVIEENQNVIPNVCIGKFESAITRAAQPLSRSKPQSKPRSVSQSKSQSGLSGLSGLNGPSGLSDGLNEPRKSVEEIETEETYVLDITLSTPTSKEKTI
jgi:hypothetical protein